MKKWCIKVTEENLPIVGKWFNVNSQRATNMINYEDIFIYKHKGYLHYPIVEHRHYSLDIERGYTELTFEQFKEQILKEPNVLQEILDKIEAKSYYFLDTKDLIVDLEDIEQIFSNYLNK